MKRNVVATVLSTLMFTQSAFAGLIHENEIGLGFVPLEEIEGLEDKKDAFFIRSKDFRNQFKVRESFEIWSATSSEFFEEKINSSHTVHFEEDGFLYKIGDHVPAGFVFPCKGPLDLHAVLLTDLKGSPLWGDFISPRGKTLRFKSGASVCVSIASNNLKTLCIRIDELPEGKELDGSLSFVRSGTSVLKEIFRSKGDKIFILFVKFEDFWKTPGTYSLEISIGEESLIYEIPTI
jgi:hypothetical protein